MNKRMREFMCLLIMFNEITQIIYGLLIMYKSSFHLQGWETEEIAPPLSHRLQLQPLQEIITKAHDNSPKTTIKKLPPFSFTKLIDRNSEAFHSTNAIRKKIKTQPEKIEHKTITQPIKTIIQQHNQENPHQQYFKKTDANASFFKSIITFIEKQPTALKKSPRFILENKKQQQIYFPKNKRHSKSMNLLIKKDPIKTKEKFDTLSKFKISFKPQDLSNKANPVSKQQSLKKLKRFFLQTIQGIQGRKQQEKLQKNHEVKLKNMLQKSNRKKKEIEQLFKTRLVIGQNLHEQRVKNKIRKILIQPEQRMKHKSRNRLFANEFDDEGLFCPWNYKDEKIINYLKAKHHQ